MNKAAYRRVLPIVLGIASLALIWLCVYQSRRCVFYDAGRPFWECESADYFLAVLNAPAIAFSRLLVSSWTTRPFQIENVIAYPLSLFWWRFVGRRLDFGLVPASLLRKRRRWAIVYSATAIFLAAALAYDLWQPISFHLRFPSTGAPEYFVLRLYVWSLPTDIWLVLLMWGSTASATRLFRGEFHAVPAPRIGARGWTVIATLLAAYSVVAAIVFYRQHMVEMRRQEQYDLQSQIIKGKVLDDKGAPIEAIEVALVARFKSGDAKWPPEVEDWTNKSGEYTLRPEEPGDYFLAVLWNEAPYKEEPFLSRYYPDALNEGGAETLHILPAFHANLKDMHLQRLPLQKIHVDVTWSTGEPAPDAYMFFTNTLYPHQGSIGSMAFHTDADGTVTLPANYEYNSNAQIDCDGGAQIGNRYGPSVRVSTKQGVPPQQIHLVLPGPPCVVWHPRD